MKKVSLIIIFMLPVLMFSQKSELNQLFDKYSGQEGYTSIHITKYMFQMFSEVADEKEDKELKEVTSNLEGIKILTVSKDASDNKKKSFKDEIIKQLPKSVYKDLMVIREGKKVVTFMIREEGKKISELVMFVNEPDETVLLYLDGDIDLKKVSKLSKSMKIDGFEHLDKIDEKE